jgi:hypothetical protein
MKLVEWRWNQFVPFEQEVAIKDVFIELAEEMVEMRLERKKAFPRTADGA